MTRNYELYDRNTISAALQDAEQLRKESLAWRARIYQDAAARLPLDHAARLQLDMDPSRPPWWRVAAADETTREAWTLCLAESVVALRKSKKPHDAAERPKDSPKNFTTSLGPSLWQATLGKELASLQRQSRWMEQQRLQQAPPASS